MTELWRVVVEIKLLKFGLVNRQKGELYLAARAIAPSATPWVIALFYILDKSNIMC